MVKLAQFYTLLLYVRLGLCQRPLESLFETSDIISLHLPLSEKTRYRVSTRTIALMNRKPIIVNG
jgi:lactate dehydrogenase-like 2-hydroxyacid dehydrogenase